ncbi:MAG TPA: hypothetical protein VMZ22_06270 [Acidimicrobiales bacterium]|nr:hypothetical protein [Acidimicrobiales bacterium]
MSEVDRRLAEVAAANHCLFTMSEVLAAGGNETLARRRVLAGFWDHPYETVFHVAGAPWTYEAKLLAAVLAAGEGACASHYCACRLLGIAYPFAPAEISIPRGAFFRSKGIVVHTSTDLDRCKILTRNRIPVTDPNRMLLDVARYLRGASLRGVVEDARRSTDEVDWHSLIECVSVHARQGRRGINRMREVIAASMVNTEVTETDGELAAVGLLREHGFGEPRLQYKVYAEDGRLVANMDAAYPSDRVNFEIDGSVHQRADVLLKDKARDHELRVIYGWTVERIPAEIPVRNPRLFVNIARQTFKEARARAAAVIP